MRKKHIGKSEALWHEVEVSKVIELILHRQLR